MTNTPAGTFHNPCLSPTPQCSPVFTFYKILYFLVAPILFYFYLSIKSIYYILCSMPDEMIFFFLDFKKSYIPLLASWQFLEVFGDLFPF